MRPEDLSGYVDVMHACSPDPVSRESVLKRAMLPDNEARRFGRVVVRDGGRVVAAGEVLLRDSDNTHLAFGTVGVDAAFRRRGYGSAVLRDLVALSAGRSVLMLEGVDEDGPGRPWADALGFSVAQRTERMVRDMSVPVAPVAVPEGYVLESWTRTPERLVESFARARRAIADVPLGDLAIAIPEWTVERVRKHEEGLAARGKAGHIVAAVHVASGEVAGLTELELDVEGAVQAVQQDTAVLSAHRGMGLGVVMKVANLEWLAANRPGVTSVRTTTAADNAPMLRVNASVGFTVARRMQNRQLAL